MNQATYTPDRVTVMDMTLDKLAYNALPPRSWGQFKKHLYQFNGNPPTIRDVIERDAPLSYLLGIKGIRENTANTLLGALVRAGVSIPGAIEAPVRRSVGRPPKHRLETKPAVSNGLEGFSIRLGSELAKTGITWKQLGERSGIQEATIRHWSDGTGVPSLTMLSKVLDVLWWVDARKLICG